MQAGETATFTGRLTRDDTGAGVAGATIKILDSDLIGDDLLAQDITDSGGYYSIPWTAERSWDDFDDTVEPYAKFEGTAGLSSSSSTQYSINIIPVEKISTTLILDDPLDNIHQGANITFTGRLTRDDTGAGVAGANIEIFDKDLMGSADTMVSGTVGNDGYFSISWIAEPMDLWDRDIEVYAQYKGSARLVSSQSQTYTLVIFGKIETMLTLDIPLATIPEDNKVVLTGRLTRSDTREGLAGCRVVIFDHDPFPGADDFLGSSVTDGEGYYTMIWTAEKTDWLDSTTELIAKFFGSVQFNYSESGIHTITITEKLITLDNLGINSLERILGGLSLSTGIKFPDFAFHFSPTPEGGKELYFKLKSAEVTARWDIEGQLTYWSATGEAEGIISLGSYLLFAAAGPVPVVLTVDYRILAGIELSGNTQVGQTGNVEIKPYLKGIVQVHLYGIFGPEGTIKPYLRAQYTGQWSVLAGVEAQIKLELDIFGYTEYTLWDTDIRHEVQLYPKE